MRLMTTVGERLRQLATGAAERADAIFLLAAGATVGLLGVFGLVKGDNLTSATLFVLAVLGFALIRERSHRLRTNENVASLAEDVAGTREAVSSLHSGSPYHVLLDEATWDISAPDGSKAKGARKKKIKFVQNRVFALYDFAEGDGREDDVRYTPGTKVHEFPFEGRRYRVISLGRFYSRDDEIDFSIERNLTDSFLKQSENIGVRTLDITNRLRMNVIWPRDRKPRAVRLGKTTASGVSHYDDVTAQMTVRDGRPFYSVEIAEPEQGGLITVEWEWPAP
jgi:membrane protein implicated in regulation of membrane protease activity